jgi:hypothetical protein
MTTAPAPPPEGTPSPVGALTKLIREAATRDSYGTLAKRAIDPVTGETISKPYLHKLAGATPSAKPPGAAQLRAIAAGIRIPERVVQRAAAEQWLGYTATELSGLDDDVRIIVAHLAAKPPRERRRWRAMMEAEDQATDSE